MEAQFIRFEELRPFDLAEGVAGRPLFGANAMINLIEFEPGAVVPLHSHPHEQLGIVLRGVQVLAGDVVERLSGPALLYVDANGTPCTIGFDEISARAARWAALLRRSGLERGDRVLALVGKRPDWHCL